MTASRTAKQERLRSQSAPDRPVARTGGSKAMSRSQHGADQRSQRTSRLVPMPLRATRTRHTTPTVETSGSRAEPRRCPSASQPQGPRTTGVRCRHEVHPYISLHSDMTRPSPATLTWAQSHGRLAGDIASAAPPALASAARRPTFSNPPSLKIEPNSGGLHDRRHKGRHSVHDHRRGPPRSSTATLRAASKAGAAPITPTHPQFASGRKLART